MRSRAEIQFRMAQEASDLWMRVLPPRADVSRVGRIERLPRAPVDALRGTPYAAAVETLAAEILAHRFPLLGTTIETGPEIEWRRDPVSGITTPPRYFRRIPYLDARRAGDHKFIWELNRHQHWVLLAQAYLLTGRREFLDEIAAELDSWVRQNPFLGGINWTSALEVGFRALSWVWVYHLAGEAMDPTFRRRFLLELYRHGCYLKHNLSVYFSPNTHLLGEAVALETLGLLFGGGWAETGARIVREQMEAQVREDGSHFEQSSYYHVYALDMFLFHAVLADEGARYKDKLGRMAAYLCDLLGPARTLSFLGDDDGGRFFHPYGDRARFGRATLATASALLDRCDQGAASEDAWEQAAWWLGPGAIRSSPEAAFTSKVYRNAGVAVLTAGTTHALVDAGPFGPGSGGHSHSDTLSLVLRAGADEVLIDPGTYTYVGDAQWRDRFRGSAAHNTVRIAGRDQAVPAGPFRWTEPPRVEIRQWASGPDQDYLEAAVAYGGFEHCRRVLFVKPDLVFILDEVTGPEGECLAEQFWHPGAGVTALGPGSFRIGRAAALTFSAPAEVSEGGEFGWRSAALGVKTPAPLLRVSQTATPPVYFAAMLDLAPGIRLSRISILQSHDQAIELQVEGDPEGTIRFPRGGEPVSRLTPPSGR